MRTSHFRAFAMFLGVYTAGVAPVAAQQPRADAGATQSIRQEIEQLRKDFEARLSALESKLSSIEGGAAPAPPPAQAPPQPTVEVPAGAAGAGGPTGALPVYGAPSAASKIFNPDIAVIGNFLGALGENDVRPAPALQMPESELSLQAIIDPYARAHL